MKLFTLNVFENFECLAGECRHSCCTGWEIDVDEATLKSYKKCKTPFYKKLKQGVDFKNGCFKLCPDGKCFFLNSDGLCDIIVNLGKNALCQVCRDHPRYRNFLRDSVEYGIGVCCEVGAKAVIDFNGDIKLVPAPADAVRELPAILSDDARDYSADGSPDVSSDNPCGVSFSAPDGMKNKAETEWERTMLLFREKAFSLFAERETPFGLKIEAALKICGVKRENLYEREWKAQLRQLEILFDLWKERVDNADFVAARVFKDEKAFSNLAAYFIHRHVTQAFDETDLKSRLFFCVLSLFIINAVYEGNKNLAQNACSLADAAREYSVEIEYSDENYQKLLDVADTLITL